MADELDRARVEGLVMAIMEPIRDHYLAGPPGRGRVLEALNALATTVATVVAGTGDREARRFFDQALSGELDDLKRM